MYRVLLALAFTTYLFPGHFGQTSSDADIWFVKWYSNSSYPEPKTKDRVFFIYNRIQQDIEADVQCDVYQKNKTVFSWGIRGLNVSCFRKSKNFTMPGHCNKKGLMESWSILFKVRNIEFVSASDIRFVSKPLKDDGSLDYTRMTLDFLGNCISLTSEINGVFNTSMQMFKRDLHGVVLTTRREQLAESANAE